MAGKYRKSYRLPEGMCPRCGRVWNAAGHPDHSHKPAPGDLGVCVGCAAINQYGEDMRLLPTTPHQLAEWAREDPELIGAVQAAQRAVLGTILESIALTGAPPRGKQGGSGRA